MDTFLYVIVLLVCPFSLGLSIRRLKHNTANMELYEEGCQLLRAEKLYISEEQRDELLNRVYSLAKSRRYAALDAGIIIINLFSLMYTVYTMIGRLL